MPSLNPLRGAPAQPPTINSDEIFPLHFLDNQMSPRELVLSHTLLFNSVLDAKKLHDGLVKLVSSGDWRKLGGRLRKQVSDDPVVLASGVMGNRLIIASTRPLV